MEEIKMCKNFYRQNNENFCTCGENSPTKCNGENKGCFHYEPRIKKGTCENCHKEKLINAGNVCFECFKTSG